MFSVEFENFSSESIVDQIKAEGYFALAGALTAEFVGKMNQDVGPLEVSVNKNHVPAVVYKNQRYLTHCLAHSRTIYDLMTSEPLLGVMRGYFGDQFRLTDQRVYVTEAGEKMQWHVDNKLDSGLKTNYSGLIFIFYLSDVTQGQFQIVKSSHLWSRTHAEADFLDSFIAGSRQGEVVDFKMPKGSVIVYTTDLIHRAAPIKDKQWERTSLFFQVERKQQGGEPILLDTSFLRDLTEEKKTFLGFGADPEYGIFPPTDINTMRIKHLLRIASLCLVHSFRAAIMNRLWKMSPDSRVRLKHILGKNRPISRGSELHPKQ